MSEKTYQSGEALEATEGDPQRGPEAMYWKAVSVFEVSGDRFPESAWLKKASYIRI